MGQNDLIFFSYILSSLSTWQLIIVRYNNMNIEFFFVTKAKKGNKRRRRGSCSLTKGFDTSPFFFSFDFTHIYSEASFAI